MSRTPTTLSRQMNPLERGLLGVPIQKFPTVIPGLAAAILLAWLSTWLCDFIGTRLMGFTKTPISAVMMAILLGLVVGNLVRLPAALKPGLDFAVKKVLRWGVILLGIRLSIFDVFQLGALGVPIVLSCIVGALLLTTLLSRWLRLPGRLGTLIAVGTSICGVSAIVATGPAIRAKDEEVAYAVAVITIFGLLATLVYPYVAHLLFAGDPVKAGLFLGTSVHDTSQVTGAALVFADVFSLPRALDVATVTKLVRNAFMVAAIPLMAFYYTCKTKGECEAAGEKTSLLKLLPFFIVGFMLLAALRSIGDAGLNAGGRALGLWDTTAWSSITGSMNGWAVNFLIVALAGVGLNTRFRTFKGLGLKPFIVGLGAAILVGAISFAAIFLLGKFVTL